MPCRAIDDDLMLAWESPPSNWTSQLSTSGKGADLVWEEVTLSSAVESILEST